MADVNITINGQALSVPAGITILKAARQAGIDIPTLCDHAALTPVGGCRMCVVEVEGVRNLQTACTYPVSEGMVVLTESPRIFSARKLVIDMLFSERNHFCMYCESSGDCELQSMGYRFDVDHWAFPTYTKSFPLDATHPYLFMDHNRCILCGRCVRGCSDRVANHTLGLRERGTASMIHADANLRWGDSSCISCGTCLQVCPTGAISEKRCAYMGHDKDMGHVKSTCDRCSVGCGIEIVTRGGNAIRIRGDWDGEVNKGLLCKMGRFEPFSETRQRIAEPMLRRGGRLEPISWKDAAQTLAKRISSADARDIGVLASSAITNEALYLMGRLFRGEMQASKVGLLNNIAMKPFGSREGSLADIEGGDLIVVVGVDPVNDLPVASYFVKRAFDRGTRVILVDDAADNGMAPFAYLNLGMAEIEQAVEIAARAEHPVVVYGSRLAGKAAEALKKMGDQALYIALESGANARGAEAFGFKGGFDPTGVKFLYVALGEQPWLDKELLGKIDRKAFVAVQAGFASPLTDRADLVLPAAIWSERSGTLTNTEGRILPLGRAVAPAGEAKADWEILSLVADKLGKKLGASLDELSSAATLTINERRNRHGKS